MNMKLEQKGKLETKRGQLKSSKTIYTCHNAISFIMEFEWPNMSSNVLLHKKLFQGMEIYEIELD